MTLLSLMHSLCPIQASYPLFFNVSYHILFTLSYGQRRQSIVCNRGSTKPISTKFLFSIALHTCIDFIVFVFRIKNKLIKRFKISPVFKIRVPGITQSNRNAAVFFGNRINRVVYFLNYTLLVQSFLSFYIGKSVRDVSFYRDFFDVFDSLEP